MMRALKIAIAALGLIGAAAVIAPAPASAHYFRHGGIGFRTPCYGFYRPAVWGAYGYGGYRPFWRPAWYRPHWGYRTYGFYGRPFGFGRFAFHRPFGFRHFAFHRPFGFRHFAFHRPFGFRHFAFHRPFGFRHFAFHGRPMGGRGFGHAFGRASGGHGVGGFGRSFGGHGFRR
jgi:hypothetical protein